ncbi:MAG: hypothetical protein LBC80_08630 [Treponema sp.]|nr:hypothetical protein [Treponema sp.]
MINVEAEVNKYKSSRDRDELGRRIYEYKSLALKHSHDIIKAGQYNMVALKLQEICDKLPAPILKRAGSNTHTAPVKTATITNEENKKINAAWENIAKKNKR